MAKNLGFQKKREKDRVVVDMIENHRANTAQVAPYFS